MPPTPPTCERAVETPAGATPWGLVALCAASLIVAASGVWWWVG